MASMTQQNACNVCQNGIALCAGCGARFCLLHFTEHRQILDKQMQEVINEHDQLREAIASKGTKDGLLVKIEEWEKTSIQKINDTAKQARIDLQACIERTKYRLIESLGNMADQFKSSQAATMYTEKELDGWMKQLADLRCMLDKPLSIEIVDDQAASSSFRLIKVVEKSNVETFSDADETQKQTEQISAAPTTSKYIS